MCFDPHNLKHELCMLVTLVLFMAIIIPSTQLHILVKSVKKKNKTKNRHFVVSRPFGGLVFLFWFFFFWLAEVGPATEEISVRPPNGLIHPATRIQDGWGAAVAAIRLHPITLGGQVRV